MTRPAVEGGARLRYSKLEGLGTRLQEQWVRPPLHLAKAYHEKDWAISLLTSPTAGLLEGDRLDVDVVVESGASVGLISPASCRVHTMESGCAKVHQRFKLESGAVLDVWPAPMVLQRGASLEQLTRVDVASDAVLLLCEIISPGRAAHGENFEFTRWKSQLKIYREGQLAVYENFECCPQRGDVQDWRERYPSGQYANLYFFCPVKLDELVQDLHELELLDATLGASLVRGGGIGVKLLAADGVSLRKAIFAVRERLIQRTGVSFPAALQRGQTFFS
ncbi:Urease accessory protein UreD [Coraliomargarita akajimensis DSM 45221]|uniref:Urease accessory protein UreD n=2 Tax=Coraliomargarita TaxID=442430 RepID=D5EM18_CORAD|nr:Urease accessory protein UreD [Coraliomargarita akajimensis DSM 45221]